MQKAVMKRHKQCGNCRYYRAYYTKSLCDFFKERAGFCSLSEKNAPENGYCDAHRRRLNEEKKLTPDLFDKALADIETLARKLSDGNPSLGLPTVCSLPKKICFPAAIIASQRR